MATNLRSEKNRATAVLTFYEENERRPCTLDWNVLSQLEQAVKEIEGDGEVRVAILQSASPKSFIVGANIQVLQTLDAENIAHWVRNGHRIFNMLQALKIPVIAKVESYALGGGLELAMACDMIVATNTALFAQPEASLGVMPGWGGSCRLAKLVGMNRAKEMFFTGKMITAQQAYEWGLVNRVCEEEQIDAVVDELVDAMLKNDAHVLGLVKEIINRHGQKNIAQNAFEEAVTSSVCMASNATQQRLREFFDKRMK